MHKITTNSLKHNHWTYECVYRDISLNLKYYMANNSLQQNDSVGTKMLTLKLCN